MTRKRKVTSAPAADETPRTAVSAKLAGLIRAMDAGLMDEFGPYAAFAYAIMGGDGLIAASNSKHGVVKPLVAADASPAGSAAVEGGDAK